MIPSKIIVAIVMKFKLFIKFFILMRSELFQKPFSAVKKVVAAPLS